MRLLSSHPPFPAKGASREIPSMLASIPVLRGLSFETVKILAEEAKVSRFSKHQYVFDCGDAPTGLYFLFEGRIRLIVPTKNGYERTAGMFDNGSIFGELGVFNTHRYIARACAATNVRVVHVPTASVRQAVEFDHEFALRMLDSVVGRMQNYIESTTQMAVYNIKQRVIAYLLEHADGSAGDEYVRLPAQKQVIASVLNMRGESFSRVLADLKDESLISVNGNLIRLLDMPKLKAALNKRRRRTQKSTAIAGSTG